MKNTTSPLRKARTAVELLFLVGLSILLLGAGTGHLSWMAEIQFIPTVSRVIAEATLLNLGVLLFLLATTLVFGRIYCSTICPLGSFQDVLIRVESFLRNRIFKHSGSKSGTGSMRFVHSLGFRPDRKILRYGILTIYAVCLVAAFQPVIALLAPYSAYGRILHLFHSQISLVGTITLSVIVLLSCLGGRLWCNLFCPVGTLLGLISRKSAFKIRIDEGKCVSCGLCDRQCKASCIDITSHTIDSSRCVVCFDCLDNCHSGAISFTAAASDKKISGRAVPSAEKDVTDKGRRGFLSTGAAIAVAVLLPDGLSAAEDAGSKKDCRHFRPERQSPKRKSAPLPPGAKSVNHLYDRCTACQLCISACPNGVLKPFTDRTHLMVPQMDFSDGWCRPECNTCSTVCPSGAILPLKKGEKAGISIGVASIDRQRCVVNTDDVACGNCAVHCPSGAIKMIRIEGYGKRQPVIDVSMCTGCGACEYLCPSRPQPAIVVNGRTVHRTLFSD